MAVCAGCSSLDCNCGLEVESLSDCLEMDLVGDGSAEAPYTITAELLLDSDPNNLLECTVDGLVAIAPESEITVRKNSGADVGTRPRINFIEGTNITLTVADDAGDDEVDVTITAAGDAVDQITVRKNSGADVGTRPRINLIEGSNVTLTVADDAGSNEVDITIAASGGGGSADETLLWMGIGL